jgi:hypothetical protein
VSPTKDEIDIALTLAADGHVVVVDVFESKDPPKKALERMILENGGEFAQGRTEENLAIPIGSRLGRKSDQTDMGSSASGLLIRLWL